MNIESVQYLTDEKGTRTAVVIPIQGNEPALDEFLEDLYGHSIIQKRRKEKTISKDLLLKGLKNDGLL
jgi:hypothetical protein